VVVGAIRVEPLLHGPSRHAKRTTAGRCLDGLEVQPVDCARTYERFDLGADFRGEGFFEPPFLAASCEVASGASNSASAHGSQASQ
jgi:hypothetical protein